MKKNKFHFYRQLDQKDCGPTCLRMIAKYYGKTFTREFLREKAHITKQGVTLSGISEAAEVIGMRTLGMKVEFETLLKEAPLPLIVPWRQKHFVVVYEIGKNKIQVADPAYGLITYSYSEFLDGWNGNSADNTGFVLLLEASPEFYKQDSQESQSKGFAFLRSYFKPYTKLIRQLLIGLFIGSIIQLIFPFLMQSIVDYGINYQNIHFIYLILIAQLVLFFSQTIVRILREWLLLHVTSRLNIQMVSDFLLKMLRLPLSYFDTRNTGEHLQRITDHDRIRSFVSSTTLNMVFSVITFIIFNIILAYYDLTVFGIFLTGATLYVVWAMFFLKKRAELDYKMFDELSESQTSLVQIVNGIKEIKINNSQRKKRWKWENIQISLFKISIRSLKLSQFQAIGSSFINELKNIIITFVSAKAVVDGELTLGMMLSIQYITGQLNLPLSNFIAFLQTGQDAKISLERLSQVHDRDDEDQVNKNKNNYLPEDKSIRIENLSFRYGGNSTPLVLKDISCQIPEGKTTAIVGASGSGKTTLIKLLLKFYEPTEGSITVGETPLNSIYNDFWRLNCGAVMQDNYIFNDTLAGNITEAEQNEVIDRTKLIDASKVANIDKFISSLPNNYNTEIGSSGIRLSGGQEQRIIIARAVYKNPMYLFFDEATSALDANNEKIITENLQRYLQGKTSIIVAHRLSTVKNADNIIVLDNGEIVEEGTHEYLTSLKGAYYNLVKNQLELGN